MLRYVVTKLESSSLENSAEVIITHHLIHILSRKYQFILLTIRFSHENISFRPIKPKKPIYNYITKQSISSHAP